MNYSVIDLFAGAGGLSYGFTQTEKFDIKLAAENNVSAQKTYIRNHQGTEIVNNVCNINYKKVKEKYGAIDVVIGGPPCQGFSNANRQKNTAISSNNNLVKEYVRAICELRPKAFVMENVSMIGSETHRFYYSENDRELIDSLNISMKVMNLELLPKEIVLKDFNEVVQNEKFSFEHLWTEKEYLALNLLYKQKKNPEKLKMSAEKHKKTLSAFCNKAIQNHNSEDQIKYWDYEMACILLTFLSKSQVDAKQLIDVLEKPIFVQRMFNKLNELRINRIIIEEFITEEGLFAKVYSYAVLDYIKSVLQSKPYNYEIKSDTLNAVDFGVPQKRQRFIIMGVKSKIKREFSLPKPIVEPKDYKTVRHAIEDLESVIPVFNMNSKPQPLTKIKLSHNSLAFQLRNSKVLYNHIATETTATAKKRFENLSQGENFHDLPKELKGTYTDPSRTQNTIYLRIKYDEPSGTVMNVRKSMWIHPSISRALSIREAARLQTFPDSFIFEGTKNDQYQQVGNAVPPLLAKKLAEKILELLE